MSDAGLHEERRQFNTRIAELEAQLTQCQQRLAEVEADAEASYKRGQLKLEHAATRLAEVERERSKATQALVVAYDERDALQRENQELKARRADPNRKLTDKELADPEYMQAYVESCFESIDDLVRELATVRAALKAFTETYRVLYNVDQVYATSREQQQQLEQDLRSAYEQALAGRRGEE